MAMSGGTSHLVKSSLTESDHWVRLYIYTKVVSQSIANNTTTLALGMYVDSQYAIGTWNDYAGGSYVGTATSGTGYFPFSGTIGNGSGVRWIVQNKEVTISHNADGTKNQTIYWKWNVNSPWGGMVYPSGSFTISLPTIPRKSSITVTNANIGSTSTISISRATSTFTHTLTYAFGNLTGTIATKTTSTSVNWTIPTTFYNQFTNASNGYGSITCETFSGTTSVGSTTTNFYAYCVNSSVSLSSVDIGSNTTINISRPYSGYTHTVTYSFAGENGALTGTLATKTSNTSVTWTTPTSFLNALPSKSSGVVTITCTAYNGTAVVGSSTSTATLSVGAGIVPVINSVTLSPVNTNSWFNTKKYYVANHSKIRVQTNAKAGDGASISSISISNIGSGTGADWTSGTLTAGTKTVNISVKDTRGRIATYSNNSIVFLSYSAPSIASFTYARGAWDGTTWTENKDGQDVRVFFNSSVTLTSNTWSYKLYLDNTSIFESTGIGSGIGQLKYKEDVTTERTHTLKLVVSDLAGNSVTKEITLPTSAVTMDFHSSGTGLSLGKVSEYNNMLDVQWNAKFRGSLNVDTLIVNTGNVYDGSGNPIELPAQDRVTISSVAGLTEALGLKQDSLPNYGVVSGINASKISLWDSVANKQDKLSNATVLDDITATKMNLWDSVVNKQDKLDNASVISTITDDDKIKWNTVTNKQDTLSNANTLANITPVMINNWNSVTLKQDKLNNANALANITQEKIDTWDNVVNKQDALSNAPILSTINFEDLTKWNTVINKQDILNNAPILRTITQQDVDYWRTEKTIDHTELINLDADNQHPINAITGLQDILNSKIDGAYTENSLLYLTANGATIGEPIPIIGTGGGSSGNIGSVLKVRIEGNSYISVAEGNPAIVSYNFSSIDGDDGISTGNGTAVYTINNQVRASVSISQGITRFDATRFLNLGENSVKVTVTDSYGNSRSISFTVNLIQLSLETTFDDTLFYNDTITFKYTAYGVVSKTIYYELDGKVVGNITTSYSGRQLSFNFPKQNHGSHKIKVYATANINGSTVKSNELYYEIICIEEGNQTPIIASNFNKTTARQYEKILIPYIVYNPLDVYASITLNGSPLTVGRTRQIWTTRSDEAGDKTFTIATGNISKTFTLNITPTTINIEAETSDLELELTSYGRNNNEFNKDNWSFEDISAIFSGFNWSTDGWVQDSKGNSVMRVSGDGRIVIPLKIFSEDFRTYGKTIEFEFSTKNVLNYDAVIFDCFSNNRGFQVTAQMATLKSEQTTVQAPFKEDERVRMSFAVEERALNRLVYCYINGVLSKVAQYPTDDDFSQSAPVNITIGSNMCTLDVYNVRVYDNDLNQFQMLDNYIADMDDLDTKLELFEKNDIFDAYGNISYSKVLQQIPCMTVIGDLPTYKGDKKTVRLTYENVQEPSRSFVASDVQIDVQGTSSQYYPRKNFKTKLNNGCTYTSNGQWSELYKLRENSIPAKVFCEKADFMESSGTHNTGFAKYIPSLYSELTPAQQRDGRARTTIDGFPIVIFHKETEDSEPVFVGKYNFNFDKDAEAVFGFTSEFPNCECWEILNNTSERVLYKTSNYEDGEWKNDFEARYPEKNTNYTNLKRLTDWISSTYTETATGNVLATPITWEGVTYTNDTAEYRLAKFKNEFEQYINKHYALIYYITSETFGLVDNRTKNAFPTTWDGNLWYFIYYDIDTALGLNNEGVNDFSYNIEYHDRKGTETVWNGESSVLWNNIEQCFASEIDALYKTLRSNGKLSYEAVTKVLNEEQADRICEAIYNMDAQFKYIDPLTKGYAGTDGVVTYPNYLYTAQGNRTEHRKWWLSNRFNYMDSKYTAGNYQDDYATMRLFTPNEWGGVAPNADYVLKAYADQYLKVKWGSYEKSVRGFRNNTYTLPAPVGSTFSDTETIIYGASKLSSIGDLSGKYAKSIDVSKAIKLTELIVGSNAQGYSNTNLIELHLGANKLLKKLDVRNCPNLVAPLDVSGCENIEEIYAEGTNITSVVLASGGNLKKLHLPSSITNLSILNQPLLTDFTVPSFANITTLRLENAPINPFDIIEEATNLDRLRLIDVAWVLPDTSMLYDLKGLRGLDAVGNNLDKPVISGSVFINNTITLSDFVHLQDYYTGMYLFFNDITGVLKDKDNEYIVGTNDNILVANVGGYDLDYSVEELNQFIEQVFQYL